MRIILHIGMPKAGSNALQRNLAASRDYLLKNNILYPKSVEASSDRHHFLNFAVKPFHKMPTAIRFNKKYNESNIEKRFQNFWESIENQINEHTPQITILSSEALFSTPKKNHGELLRKLLSELSNDVIVVAYIRKPSEWIFPIIQERLKRSAKLRFPINEVSNVRRTIEAYENLFGRESLRVIQYSRDNFEGGNIVADFCNRFLKDHKVTPEHLAYVSTPNKSLSAESAYILQRYRAVFHKDKDNFSTKDTNELINMLKEAEVKTGEPKKANLNEEIANVVDYTTTDLLWLKERYGVKFSDIDYAKIGSAEFDSSLLKQINGIEDLINIDVKYKKNLLTNLKSTDWAQSSQEIKGWLDEEINNCKDESYFESYQKGLIDSLRYGTEDIEVIGDQELKRILSNKLPLDDLTKHPQFFTEEIIVKRDEFKKFCDQVDYENNFPSYVQQFSPPKNKPHAILKKKYEHFVSLCIAPPEKCSLCIDVACSKSPFYLICEKLYGVENFWRQGLTNVASGPKSIQCNASCFPLPDAAVDLLYLHNSWEHFQPDDDVKFLIEAERMLKSEGRVVIVPLKAGGDAVVRTDPSVWGKKQAVEKTKPPMLRSEIPIYFSQNKQAYDQQIDHRLLKKFAEKTPKLVYRIVDVSTDIPFEEGFTGSFQCLVAEKKET